MLLKSLRMKNIRSYLDQAIEFPEGSTLLSGDVGCGKSTILLAMDFALFGLRKGELGGTDLLRHGKNEGSVELTFDVSGMEITIKRTLKRSKGAVGQDSGTLSMNGTEQELMPVELKAKMVEMLGYSQDIVRKNRPIFRYTVYTPQEKMKDILFDENTRLETLRKIFSVDKYGQIKSNAKMFVSELRSMKRENEALSKDLEKKLAEKQEKETERERLLVMLDRHNIELSSLDMLLQEKQGEFDALKRKMSEMESVRREIARKEAEIRVKSGRLPVIEREMSSISEKTSSFSFTKENYDISALVSEMDELEGKKGKLISEQAVLTSEMSRLGSVLKDGVCSFCGQKINDKTGFQKHLSEKEWILSELKKNTEFADARLIKLKEQKRLTEKIESEMRLREEYEKRKNSLEAEHASITSDLTALRDELSMLSSVDKSIVEENYYKIEEEINSVNMSRLVAEKEKSRCEQQLYDMKNFLLSVDREVKEKQAARDKIIYINELVSWFDTYFIELMDIIERRVMAALQQVFNDFFQKWFGIIMGEQFSVRVDENFSPVIEQNGYVTEYSNLSGGEKTAVALAYRLALNRVINAMIETIKTKDILILDEPTDGFSSEQLDRIRDVIAELQVKQVILVSHEPKIDTFVDNVIKVYKEDHISRVVY